MKRILVVAQIPPPVHGQSVMQQYLVNAEWSWCQKEHIRLSYSDSINKIGRFQFSKVVKLVRVVCKIITKRTNGNVDLLYYPPAGPNRIPLYRDIITLLVAKLMVRKIVLHFHAGGLPVLINKLSLIERYFAKLAFQNIDCAIVLLPWLRKEVEWFSPKNISVVPNGIEDVARSFSSSYIRASSDDVTNILFVGNLKDEKGIFVLLAAIPELKKITKLFKVGIMGEAHSDEVKQKIEKYINEHGIADHVLLFGGLTGNEKWEKFSRAHIFCLPTYATEAMPVSIMEAMMFSLPVVTTSWRSITDMITDQEEGFLVPVHDENELAGKLAMLIQAPSLAKEMGRKGRKKFMESYTIEKHLANMEQIFKNNS